jgi:hypothetical protein
MKIKERNPPRWAEAMLRSLLRPGDRESISGDLLEEYREVRRPALGALRADAWYIKHVLSVMWRLLWPFAITMIALKVLTLVAWLPDAALFQAPGVSAQDATLCLFAGYLHLAANGPGQDGRVPGWRDQCHWRDDGVCLRGYQDTGSCPPSVP